MKATERIFRTADGRLVPEAHPDAAFLAYPIGHKISDADASLLASPPFSDPEPAVKQAPQAANKARRPGANKAG